MFVVLRLGGTGFNPWARFLFFYYNNDSHPYAVIIPTLILIPFPGVGNKLKHFCTSSSGTTTTVLWYDFRFRDKIHGIHTAYVENSWKIWIFGGRYLALCELYPDKDNEIRLIARSKLSDVISSVAFVHYKTLDVVTTYNVALRVQLNDANRLEIVRKSVCEERSTLYCSHIVHDDVDGDWEQVLVFGGTAFGEVLIWRPHGSGKSAISYRFATSRVSSPINLLLI